MKTRTTLILFVLVLGLGLWIKFYESKRPNTDEANRLAGLVLDLDREKLTGLQIQNGETVIELRQSDGKWRLEAPIKDQADGPAVDQLISELQSWKREKTLTATTLAGEKDGLAEYDLVKPKLRLKLLGPDQPAEILFGKDAALEGRMYIRFADQQDALLVPQTVKDAIAKKPEDFRDRKLTEIAAADVTRLRLKTSAGEMELTKTGGTWEIVKPLRARADAQKVADLAAQVTGARIEQFVADDHGDLQPYGLAQPRGAITVFTAEDKEGRTLQIGAAPEGDDGQVYVRFSARNFVYTLPESIESILELKPTDLRDHHLVQFDPNLLDRITLDAPGKSKTVLARKEQTWTIANAENRPANGADVTRFLETLGKAEVTKFVEDVASDLPKYGLDQPQLQVTLSSFASENTAESKAGEQPLATISFGRTEGDEVYARIGEEPFIVAVPRSLPEGIFTDPVQWQDVALIRAKPETFQHLSITTDQALVVKRGADGAWVREGEGAPVSQAHVQSLVSTLGKLRAVRWEAAPTTPDAFAQPQIQIAVATSPDGKDAQRLVIGGPAGNGMWYGKIEGTPGVFVLSNPDFNALREPLLATPAPTPSPTPASAPATPTPPG